MPEDLSLVSSHELAQELAKRFTVLVLIGKKMNVDDKEGSITWERLQGDPNAVAGLALEASIKAIYSKVISAKPTNDF